MANTRITSTEIANSGYGKYDYDIDIRSIITDYDEKKTRFLLAMESLLREYFNDVKNQNAEYDAKLASFLVNNHSKFLKDLLEDNEILDRFSDIVYEIASSNSFDNVFTGLSKIEIDRIILELKTICIKATENIGDITNPKKYVSKINSVLDDIDKKFEKIYKGEVSNISKNRTSKSSESYVAVPEKIVSNDPTKASSFRTYGFNRTKTKSIFAKLLTLAVVEQNELDIANKIAIFSEDRIKKLQKLADKLKKNDFLKSTKKIAEIMIVPFKMFSVRFWKNITVTMQKWHLKMLNGFLYSMKKLLFPLELKIFSNLRKLKENKLFNTVIKISSKVFALTKKLASKVKFTVFKIIKGIVRILKIPWVFLIFGSIFGKLFQNIINEFVPNDSIFKTEEFESLALTGNETALQKLAKNKYLQSKPISKEILFVDSVLLGINDFIVSLDDSSNSKNSLFSDFFDMNTENSFLGNSENSVRDFTFDVLDGVFKFFNSIFDTSENPNSIRGIFNRFRISYLDPIKRELEIFDQIHNGMTFEKLTNYINQMDVIEDIGSFFRSFVEILGFKGGTAASGTLISFIPGGGLAISLFKILGILLGGFGGSKFLSSILGFGYKQSDMEHLESSRKLYESIRMDDALYSLHNPSMSSESLVQKNLKLKESLEWYEKGSSEDVNTFKMNVKKIARKSASAAQLEGQKIQNQSFSYDSSSIAVQQINDIIRQLVDKTSKEKEDIGKIRSEIINLQTQAGPTSGPNYQGKERQVKEISQKINSLLKINTTLIPQKIRIDGKNNFSLDDSEKSELNLGDFHDYANFRMARLHYINHLITLYRGNRITPEEFVKYFNNANNPNDEFYKNNAKLLKFSKDPSLDIRISSIPFGKLENRSIQFSDYQNLKWNPYYFSKAFESEYPFIKRLIESEIIPILDSLDETHKKEVQESLKAFFNSDELKNFMFDNLKNRRTRGVVISAYNERNKKSGIPPDDSVYDFAKFLGIQYVAKHILDDMTVLKKIGRNLDGIQISERVGKISSNAIQDLVGSGNYVVQNLKASISETENRRKKKEQEIQQATLNETKQTELLAEAIDISKGIFHAVSENKSSRISIENLNGEDLEKNKFAEEKTESFTSMTYNFSISPSRRAFNQINNFGYLFP